MTPPVHELRRMLTHVETAANKLRKAVAEHEMSSTTVPHRPAHVAELYIGAVERVKLCHKEMHR